MPPGTVVGTRGSIVKMNLVSGLLLSYFLTLISRPGPTEKAKYVSETNHENPLPPVSLYQ